MPWKKGGSSATTNNSTLSFHIAAFENSNEASSLNLQRSWLIQNQKQINAASTFVSQNPFEFPRQQSDRASDPEVSHFRASQSQDKDFDAAAEDEKTPSPQSPTTSFGPHNFKRDHYRHSTSGYSTPGAASVYSSYSTSPNVGCLTSVRMSAMAKLSRFLRRLVHFRQMDFEFAGWQMWSLLTHPQLVYRKFVYRKRTKDQWARDDPAFLVLLAVALSLSSILFAVVLHLSFAGFIAFYFWAVFVDCIFVGLVIATLL
uniref:Uncharacterized protein n=1 Tax=Panagrolaimus sp. PS1159 TaxID=55785 RepID=A0AC35GE95_9BILA